MVPKKPKVFKAKSNSNHAKHDPRASWARLYDATWQAYRVRFLRHNRTCYLCGKVASVVDHLTPAQGRVEVFEDLLNHLPECARCHNTITAKFDRFHTPGSPITKKLQYIADERLKNGIDSRVKVLSTYRE